MTLIFVLSSLFLTFSFSISLGAPILAFIHGGMWQMMDRTQYRSVAAGFADAGFQVVVAGYDLAPTVTLAQMESQIQQLGSFLLSKAAESGSR